MYAGKRAAVLGRAQSAVQTAAFLHEAGAEVELVARGPIIWIGTRAMILQGVTIGQGAVMMAGAVVTHDVALLAVVGGVPARQISERRLQEFTYGLITRPLVE